jgi:hypothetical protein
MAGLNLYAIVAVMLQLRKWSCAVAEAKLALWLIMTKPLPARGAESS